MARLSVRGLLRVLPRAEERRDEERRDDPRDDPRDDAGLGGRGGKGPIAILTFMVDLNSKHNSELCQLHIPPFEVQHLYNHVCLSIIDKKLVLFLVARKELLRPPQRVVFFHCANKNRLSHTCSYSIVEIQKPCFHIISEWRSNKSARIKLMLAQIRPCMILTFRTRNNLM